MNEVNPNAEPESRATVLSVIFLSWITPLFRVGAQRPLEREDMYRLSDKFRVELLAKDFERIWRDERYSGKRPQLVTVLRKQFARRFLPMGLFKFTTDIGAAVAPLIIEQILIYVSLKSSNTPQSLGLGVAYVALLFVVTMVSSFSIAQFFQRVNGIGMSVRSVLTVVIHQKSLRLSPSARQTFDSGKIMNMIATDSVRIDQFTMFFHLIWSYSIQLFVIIGLLFYTIGISAMAGVGLMLIVVPLQVMIARWLVVLRKSNATITDSRIKLTQEALQGIRIIKFFSWESSFLDRILSVRALEFSTVVKANLIRSCLVALGFTMPALAASLTFIVEGLMKPAIYPVTIFTTMALFNQLRNLIMWSPMILSILADAKIASRRIQTLLDAEELTFEPLMEVDAQDAVLIEHGSFSWDSPDASKEETENPSESTKQGILGEVKGLNNNVHLEELPEKSRQLILKDVNLKIPRGKLVAIVGPIGSGKSSLLSALIGQMQPVDKEAKVIVQNSVGYCPQQAWICNTTVKDNILFGEPLEDEKLYQDILHACSLERDLEILPNGDMTEIGERGVNISGGQKQRISLARLCYSRNEIVLLDDPLSAVDAEVGKHIFDKCIKELLHGKTILLVTHQLHFVSQCDLVVVMSGGEVVEFGSPKDLICKPDGLLAKLLQDSETSQDEGTKKTSSVHDMTEIPVSVTRTEAKGLMSKEERVTGAVDSSVLKAYGEAAGGLFFVVPFIAILVFMQLSRMATDLWLVYWTQQSVPGMTESTYLSIYGGLATFQMALVFTFAFLVALGGTRAAQTLHVKSIKSVFAAPMYFFDTTPLGRIISRFSRDQDQADNTLTDALRLFLMTFTTTISTFLLVAYITSGYFLIPFFPLCIAYYFLQKIYRSTSRELKRLESISRSPLYTHITESIIGVATIKAYRKETAFLKRTEELSDLNNRPYYMQTTGQRWLGLRLEILGNFLLLSVAIFSIFQNFASDSIIGLSLSYLLQVSSILNLCIRQFAETEVQMNAVERLDYYAKSLPSEDGSVLPGRISSSWPDKGQLEFKKLCMRYQPHLPLVLNNVTFTVQPREKIGVVGRTGSGKSSLMLAIYRLVEPSSGSVLIDGVDTKEISLRDLRTRISIIPQDPALFSGTVRSNLDPFQEHTDEEIWECLERSGVKDTVIGMSQGLESLVFSGGENLSVGQRQLFCLARALIKKSKIVILDECTANVDVATDQFIQTCLRRDFEESTVLTIAHRLNTIIDYDRILVLDQGTVAEFDSPHHLLQSPTSIFAKLVHETGEGSARSLRAAAANTSSRH